MNNQPRKSRALPASKVKKLFAQLGAELTEGMERVMATAQGNTIVFHMPGGTVNITINEKGGRG